MNLTNRKYLIAYFSRKGQNYVSGRIVDLKVGNTELAAKMIQKQTGGDLFHIETAAAYPKDYSETTQVAQNELRAKARPKLNGRVENIEAYEVIFWGIRIGGGRCLCRSIRFWRAMISRERRSCHSVPMKEAAWVAAKKILPGHAPRPPYWRDSPYRESMQALRHQKCRVGSISWGSRDFT